MSKMKILSVDDNPQNLKLIQLSLEDKFEVMSSDGSEPINDLLESFAPNVIVLDIMLGDKSGYDVCRELRASNICPDVVVIFVSSLSSLEDKLAAYGAGGDDYVCKPIDIQELERKLLSLHKRLGLHRDLEEQYEYASQAAYGSMQQSSELGQLIAFFTDTLKVYEIGQLYDVTQTFVKGFGSGCSVEFRLAQKMFQYPQGQVSTLESEILELGRSAKRLITFGNNLLVNSSWCSLLIKKMPTHDEDLCGRLRDHYAILLGILDSRLMLMDAHMNREKDTEQAVGELGAALETGLCRIKDELHDQEQQAQSIVQQLESSMSIGLVSLDLTVEQEGVLMGMVEDTRERFESMAGMSVQIGNEIRQINDLLGKIR